MSYKLSNTPWTEKYRPQKFSDIVLEEYNRKIFQNIIETDRFPHLLFYGPPGVGKTTTAENLIREYQKKNNNISKENIIVLNASDERGIEVIRNQIYQFVKSQNMFKKGYKFIILDEVDYMTKTAQQALKNLLQNCESNVRFCLICNYICKIEESLKNEFICIRFNQLPKNDIISFIKIINENENLNLSLHKIEIIQQMYEYDIRSMINFLQLHQDENDRDNICWNEEIWEDLHNHFLKMDPKNLQHIIQMIISRSYNMDIQTCIKKYFNYIIQFHTEYVNHHFLNIVENIVHNNDTHEFVLPYFVHNVIEHYKLIKIEKYNL